MSLENAIAALTAAVEANTAALLKGGGASATSTAGADKAEKKKAAAYEPKHTMEQMQALMNDVREKIGMPKAKEIRDTVGKVAKLSELTDPKVIDAVAEAAEKALAEHEEAM